MADRNLEVALRIRADLNAALTEVGKLDTALDDLGDAGKSAGKGLDAAATGADNAADSLSETGKEAAKTGGALDDLGDAGKSAGKGLDAAATSADKSASSLSRETTAATAADNALDNLSDAGKSAGKGLDTTATSADKSASSLSRDAAAANAAAAAHTKLTPAVTNNDKAMQRGAISAKQYQMAMRQLPMQMTDIVTGLVSGQPAYMVAIQQGGQLKDTFGGIAPAARALVGAISPVAVAVTAGAAAFAAIGVAVFQGYQEIQGYERALISTGNIAGQTAGQIADLADRVGESTGEYSGAEAAALQLAQSGKLAGETLEAATSAAVNLAKLTGDSIENTTVKVLKLADAPSATLAKLNEQYHFLSASVYEQVRALEEQGRTEEAVKLAVEEFARVHEQRAKEAESRAGLLERAWKKVGTTIAGVWDSMNNFGRDDAETQLRAAQSRLDALRRNRGNDRSGWSPLAEEQAEAALKAAQALVDAERQRAAEEAERQAAEDEAIRKSEERKKAGADWDRLQLSNLSKQQKLEQEIADIRKVGVTAGKSEAEIEAQIAQARERYNESLAKGPKAPKTDAQRDEEAALRELANLEKQGALLDAVGAGEKRASEEARVRYEIEQGAYQAASAATQQQLLDQARLFDSKRAARAEQEEQRKEFEKTEQEYERLRDALRTPTEVAVETAQARIETLNKALKQGTIDAAQYRTDLEKIAGAGFDKAPQFGGLSPEIGGVDSEQYRLDQAKDELEKWRTEQLALLNQYRANKIGTEAQWNAQEVQIEQQHHAALTGLQQAQSQLLMTQATSTFDSMAEIARNAAGEQSSAYRVLFAISKGFAVAQAAVSLATNMAKASELGWPANIPAIAAAFAQGAQITQILSAAQYATGGRIHGPGTGTSDSIPIWASAGEFMVRHASAREPGAYPFLEDFNKRGMDAVRDWRGYADGGLITNDPIYERGEPSIQLPAVSERQTDVKNNFRFLNLFDTEDFARRVGASPATERSVLNIISSNPSAIREALGL